MKRLSTKKKGVERKAEFVPVIAEAFIESGFARTTTAVIARKCGVRENELYRIWSNKRGMFLDSIRFIFTTTLSNWQTQMENKGKKSALEQLVEYQSKDHGQKRFYRLVFSGIVEIDDLQTRRELKILYQDFHEKITEYVLAFRSKRKGTAKLSNEDIAWAIMGIASVVDIQRELGLQSKKKRGDFMAQASLKIIRSL